MDQTWLKRRYVANRKRFPDIFAEVLPLIDIWSREHDPIAIYPAGINEEINAGGLERRQKILFTLRDFRHYGNPSFEA
jgi:hypothetical protein